MYTICLLQAFNNLFFLHLICLNIHLLSKMMSALITLMNHNQWKTLMYLLMTYLHAIYDLIKSVFGKIVSLVIHFPNFFEGTHINTNFFQIYYSSGTGCVSKYLSDVMLTPASHYLTDGFAYIQASDIEEIWLLGFFLVVGYILEVTFFLCILCYVGVFFLTLIANCWWLRELWDIAFQKN